MPTEIPVVPSVSSQTMRVELNGAFYTLKVTWNIRLEAWVLSISDEDQVLLVSELTLVQGAELLGPYPAVQGLGAMEVVDTEGHYAEATLDNLGDTVLLLYYTPEEIEGS